MVDTVTEPMTPKAGPAPEIGVAGAAPTPSLVGGANPPSETFIEWHHPSDLRGTSRRMLPIISASRMSNPLDQATADKVAREYTIAILEDIIREEAKTEQRERASQKP